MQQFDRDLAIGDLDRQASAMAVFRRRAHRAGQGYSSPAIKDLDHAGQFLVAADDAVDAAIMGFAGQVGAELSRNLRFFSVRGLGAGSPSRGAAHIADFVGILAARRRLEFAVFFSAIITIAQFGIEITRDRREVEITG